ncbi:MAG: bifunctional oligoribonuclease/PAP phosphatase NrnA [Sphingobacteriales bacterium]|nr:MAG: bifunctional oligoribonuclease/PAP phosphatase NrnA [Sphingobacteriales bacterium]
MIEIQQINDLLNSPKNIVIVTHTGPDGDAIGSSMGMYHFLNNFGHQVKVIVPNAPPSFLSFLTQADAVLNFEENEEAGANLISSADLLFVLDFNTASRAKGMDTLLTNSAAVKLMIDHHLLPDFPADFSICDSKASSTAELVYRFISLLGKRDFIGKSIADGLYTGICADTGRFKYNITPEAFKIAAFLMEQGADIEFINEQIFDSFTENRLRFLGYCITQKLKVFPEFSTAIISVTNEDMELFQYKSGDMEGIVNYPLSISSVRFSALVKEDKDVTRLSLRSKGDFPVNEFAAKFFNGGGHKNAAGGSSTLSVEETVNKIIEKLPFYTDELSPTLFAV